MKNIIIIFLVLLVLAGAGGTIYFYSELNAAQDEKVQLVQQNGELQLAIDAIGPITQVWTVNTEVYAGRLVKEEELVQQTIPVSSITENYVMNKENIVGKYYKVNLSPGVSITKDILMAEKLEEITYERDMTFSYLPLGLEVGDYIDVRIVLPYGEEFVVIQHERIQQIVAEHNTIKLVLNEAQLALWTSALKELALFKQRGIGLYVTKYIEPGITEEAVPFYPVRTEMESAVLLNPNIKDKTLCINTELRKQMHEMLINVTDENASNLSSGVTSEAASINSAKSQYYELEPTVPTNSENKGEDTIINLEPMDIDGNMSTISDSQINQTTGDNPYGDENTIE